MNTYTQDNNQLIHNIYKILDSRIDNIDISQNPEYTQ